MRILIPALGFGRAGGNRVLSELASAWVALGHEVMFLVPDSSPDPYFPTRAAICWVSPNGQISARPSEGAKETGFRNMICLWQGVRQLGSEFDVVLGNHSLTTWPIWLSFPKSRLFYYVQAYEPEYFWMERQPIKWLLSWISYKLPFKLIFNSETYRKAISRNPVSVVPFGIDLEIFRPSDHACGSANFTIGCIGRAEPSKGTPFVLKAFEQLAAEDPTIRLRVAYGNLPPDWAHPRCEVVLPRNDRELADFYRSVDVLAVAGIVQHGAPHYPVLEAMACGVPVVNTGYLPATNDNSWLVAPRDSAALAVALKFVRDDPDRERKVTAGLVDVQSYSWTSVAEELLASFSIGGHGNALSHLNAQRDDSRVSQPGAED